MNRANAKKALGVAKLQFPVVNYKGVLGDTNSRRCPNRFVDKLTLDAGRPPSYSCDSNGVCSMQTLTSSTATGGFWVPVVSSFQPTIRAFELAALWPPFFAFRWHYRLTTISTWGWAGVIRSRGLFKLNVETNWCCPAVIASQPWRARGP
jgi:hypothetical protein